MIVARDPPAMGFYGKELAACGVIVRSHADVPDEALREAARRIERLLGRCPGVRANLEAAGAELHVIGREQRPSDLPMFRHLAGKALHGELTIDERGRGYGGLHACCDEDGLLRLPTARHSDHRDICSHELAHAVQSFGLDASLREEVTGRWSAALAEGRWRGAYAATNDREFFAELTMWYVGSRGDYGALDPRPREGPDWLRAYDPASYELLDAVYSGARAPDPLVWDELAPQDADRSTWAGGSTDVLFRNATDALLELFWVDYHGERVGYGPLPAHGARGLATWVGHVWLVAAPDGRELGRYRVGAGPGRVTLVGS